jgi:L-fuculose-phosphate aldolase
MREQTLRKDLIEHALEMNATGLNQGTSGNLSIRFGDGLLITPSGVPYKQLRAEDIVLLHMDGSYRHHLAPSSEWRFHRDIMLARPEVNAIVHAHPTYCTAISIQRMEVPAVH